MPSSQHETLVELFRRRPNLAVDLLPNAEDFDLPERLLGQLRSGDLPDLVPTEYRADAVVVFAEPGEEEPALAVVVEAQLKSDKKKRFSWPVYLTTLRARLRCPAMLLVVCPDRKAAAWCSTPIAVGQPGFVLAPFVLGPHSMPLVSNAEQAVDNPELVMLSALIHPDDQEIRRALAYTLTTLQENFGEEDRADLYTALAFRALPDAARHHLEKLMDIKSDPDMSDRARFFYEHGLARGEARGVATALLSILGARGVEVSEDARRLISIEDVEQLEAWIGRAVTATSIEEVFLE